MDKYEQYEKITDDMLWLGNGVCLKMNVQLASKNNNTGMRYHFYREYTFEGTRYIGKPAVTSIKRSFNYYLSFDVADHMECSTIIRPQDMILLKVKLNEASEWFTNDEIFKEVNGRLVVFKRPNPITITGLIGNKYLKLDPVVITNENTNVSQTGVRLTVSNEDVFTDLTVETFFGLAYLISIADLFGYAQNMINALNSPLLGSHRTNLNPNNTFESRGGSTNYNYTSKDSFFDKL